MWLLTLPSLRAHCLESVLWHILLIAGHVPHPGRGNNKPLVDQNYKGHLCTQPAKLEKKGKLKINKILKHQKVSILKT